MRKIYSEYFQVPKDGEGVVREKVFYVRLIVSIVCIVLCMCAMGYNAFAYFTAGIGSNGNVLQATSYSFERADDSIRVVSGSGSAAAVNGTVGKYNLTAGTYDFILKKQGNASTGYGRIDVFDGAGNVVKSFYTKQIGVVDAEGNQVESRTIRIQTSETVTIQVVACWGTYINPIENPSFDENTRMVVIGSGANAKIDAKQDPAAVQTVESNTVAEEESSVMTIEDKTDATEQPEKTEQTEEIEENKIEE